ncbi:MAG: hypothetical protein H0W85_02820 [Methylotenera sp.]|nr:hypothetical protein [Methylotenera sp.]
MQISEIALESRLNALVNNDLFSAFWDAVDFFKTKDLVLFYDTNKNEDAITAYTREQFISSPGVPDSLKTKFKQPATETAESIENSDAAFWLLAAFNGGELASAAINVNLMAPSEDV